MEKSTGIIVGTTALFEGVYCVVLAIIYAMCKRRKMIRGEKGCCQEIGIGLHALAFILGPTIAALGAWTGVIIAKNAEKK